MRRPLIAILGPTATGKSALALALAQRHGGEIVNCDSTAVFRGFDIGTDKIAPADRRGIPHHLIDIADPTEEYTAAQFARDAAAAIRDIHARGKLPLLVASTSGRLPAACFRDPDATTRCAAVSSRSPRAVAWDSSTACWRAWIRSLAAAFSRAT